MRILMSIWIALTLWLTYEFYTVNRAPSYSVFNKIAKSVFHAQENVTMLPGRSVNYYLGWLGFGLMVIMNLYMLRKRLTMMRKWGSLRSWLNFHIFCGLMGPTFIIFHCGFKVRGLVGISFWSMIISAASGVVGRYVFGQVSRSKKELLAEAERYQQSIKKHFLNHNIDSSKPEFVAYERTLFAFVGGGGNVDSLVDVFFRSLMGDIRLKFSGSPQHRDVSQRVNDSWLQICLLKRKAELVESFERIMGYWHIFHTPFAIFMYIAAVIHIISAMIFLVK